MLLPGRHAARETRTGESGPPRRDTEGSAFIYTHERERSGASATDETRRAPQGLPEQVGGAGWEEGRTGVGSRAGPPGRAGRVARLPGPAPTRLHVPRAGSGQRPGCSSHPGRTRCPPPRRPGEDTEARRGPATWQSVAVQSRRPGPQPAGPRASTALPTAEHGSARGPHACERRPRSSSRVRRETEAQTGERPAAPDRKPEASVSCPPRARPRGLSAPPSCRVPARPGSPRPRAHPVPD